MKNLKSLSVILVLLVLAVSWMPVREAFSQAAYPEISISTAGPWYVATGGNDSNNCLAPSTPCATINAAIGKASLGDTVYVAGGTYTGEGEQVVLINKDITLSGGWDDSFISQDGFSTINGSVLRRGILINSGIAATIIRFVVTKGATDSDEGASGIFLLDNSSLTLNDSIVRDNTRMDDFVGGNGIYVLEDATLILNHSTVSYNVGVGIHNSGDMTLNQSSVSYNMSGGIVTGGNATLNNSTVDHNQNGGGITNWGSLTINNSTVSANSAGYGGGIFNVEGNSAIALVTINNSTITRNVALGLGGGIYTQAGEVHLTVTEIQNSILAGNFAASNPDCGGDLQSSGYNLIGDLSGGAIVCNFTPSIGDITGLDPSLGSLVGLLENPQYHPLLPGSPAIDTGNPAGCTGSTGDLLFDQRGAPRVGNCDIGAYEYTLPGLPSAIYAHSGSDQEAPLNSLFELPLVASVLDIMGSPVEGITVTFSAPPTGASGIYTDTGNTTTTAVTTPDSLATSAAFIANGITGGYSITATVDEVEDSAVFRMWNGPRNLYVSTTGDNGNSCTEPAQPCATINAAIGYADPGETVYTAIGTYTEDGFDGVRIAKDITLSGGWDDSFNNRVGESIIDGGGERRIIVIADFNTDVTIEKFILQNGWRPPDPVSGPYGGVVNNGSLTVTNCSIRDSIDGIENRGSLTLNATTITGNDKGIYNEGTEAVGSVVLNDSLVSNNSDGGIYSVLGVVVLNRSSVINNSGRGGIYGWGTQLTLDNSTVSGNQNTSEYSPRGGGIFISFNGATQIPISINNSSIINNSSSIGGGLAINGGAAIFSIQNSIVAGNSADEGPDCHVDDINPIISGGYNLIGDTSDCNIETIAGDLINVSPQVFPLFGSPAYHPLLRSSPAINAGNPAGCTDHEGNPLDTDQRGVARVGRCDIGAYEYDPVFDPLSYSVLPITCQNLCPDFFDDFSDPSSGWYTGETDTGRIEYRDGEYSVLVKPAEYYWVFRAPTCERVNYTVEVDAHWASASRSGASYGLIFGLQGDFEQFYSFEVNSDNQEFALYIYNASGWTVIAPIAFSPAINPGAETNHLKATRNGEAITLEVNGAILGTWTSGNIMGTSDSGLIVNSYSDADNAEARFDNFTVSGLGGMSSTSATNLESEARLLPPLDKDADVTQVDLFRTMHRSASWR